MTHEKLDGAIMHVEFYVERPAETQAFYEKAFGWRFEPIPGAGYTRMRPPAPPEGGLLAAAPGIPKVLLYVRVADRDEAARRIAEAGGTVLRQYEVPGVGRFCLFEAPGGVVQNCWEAPRG